MLACQFKFWAGAFSTAVYLINRMPVRSLHFIFPWQKLFGLQPDYSTLRVLGCACFPWLRPYTQHKLEPRSKKCVFLGYSLNYKGYKCLDYTTGRAYLSRHVVFDESSFPLKTPASSSVKTTTDTLCSFPFSAWLPSILGPYTPNPPLPIYSILRPHPNASRHTTSETTPTTSPLSITNLPVPSQNPEPVPSQYPEPVPSQDPDITLPTNNVGSPTTLPHSITNPTTATTSSPPISPAAPLHSLSTPATSSSSVGPTLCGGNKYSYLIRSLTNSNSNSQFHSYFNSKI